jgi:hypothetical protein
MAAATKTATAPTLPTWEKYRAALDRLNDACEEWLEPIAGAVGAVIGAEGEQEVTFADVGRLCAMVEYLDLQLDQLQQTREELADAIQYLNAIRLEGRNPHEPPAWAKSAAERGA